MYLTKNKTSFNITMKAIQLIVIVFLVILFAHLKLSGQNSPDQLTEKEWEAFPILNYDTDVGFGYGAKAFFYNFLETGESFDLTAYNSTKGERWYRLVYSIPDIQRRQGKKYDAAFDLIIDYDKWIKYLHYYDSDQSRENSDKDFEEYVREPLELTGLFSRAFTTDIIAELGLKFKSISCYQFAKEGILQYEKPSAVKHLSILFNFRFDTRSNFIDPKKGIVLELSNEFAKDVNGQKQDFLKMELTIQSYLQLYYPELVFASRIILQTVTDDVTYQNKLSLGGNNSVRGLPQDRYLSESSIIINEELRFPIWWKFGGVLGADIGNSKSTPNWIINAVLGIRLYMDNFIVRADFGFGKESTGIYFNFGQLF